MLPLLAIGGKGAGGGFSRAVANIKCSSGHRRGFSDWTYGGILTHYRLLHQTFCLASVLLGSTCSVIQGKSLTALTLTGKQSTTWGLHYTGEPWSRAAQTGAVMLPSPGEVMRWSVGRVLEEEGGWWLRHLDRSVARLWFNLRSTSRRFVFCHSKANIPQCETGVESIANRHFFKINDHLVC